ncbi:hypothetical protein RRG08_062292 [Elysia crispata]|uniref:Sulfotransferase n=1 Tax=Elysia crispata TaxID=231223 RepID=A0AAE0YG32_9GAST|nr:hypothetical protein RRG08_062292 [Elysia crispata]
MRRVTNLENSCSIYEVHPTKAVLDPGSDQHATMFWGTITNRALSGVASAALLLTFLILLKFQTPLSKISEAKGIESESNKRLVSEGNEVPSHSELCPPTSPRYVLLLSYGRSGSSFTSDVIGAHPDVFLYFEPLHETANIFQSHQLEYFPMMRRGLRLTRIEEDNILASRLLMKLVTCNYEKLSRLITLNHHGQYFQSTKELFQCVNR